MLKAGTGEQGIEAAVQEVPDLILMDIQLPGIDGFEATRRIRASTAAREIPIVAVTSYAMTGDRERLLAAGCNGYIEKPINPDTIMGRSRVSPGGVMRIVVVDDLVENRTSSRRS